MVSRETGRAARREENPSTVFRGEINFRRSTTGEVSRIAVHAALAAALSQLALTRVPLESLRVRGTEDL